MPVLQNGNFMPIKSSCCSLKALSKTSRTLSVPVSDEAPTPSNTEAFAARAGVPGWLAQVGTSGQALASGTAPGMPGEGLAGVKNGAAAAAPPPAAWTASPQRMACCSRRPAPSRAPSSSPSPTNGPSRYTRHKAPNKRRGAAGVLGPTKGCRGADVTRPQPVGMTHAGEQRALHGPQENKSRVGGGSGGHRSRRE